MRIPNLVKFSEREDILDEMVVTSARFSIRCLLRDSVLAVTCTAAKCNNPLLSLFISC